MFWQVGINGFFPYKNPHSIKLLPTKNVKGGIGNCRLIQTSVSMREGGYAGWWTATSYHLTPATTLHRMTDSLWGLLCRLYSHPSMDISWVIFTWYVQTITTLIVSNLLSFTTITIWNIHTYIILLHPRLQLRQEKYHFYLRLIKVRS